MIHHIRKEDFEREVLHSAEPVVLDFYADWCGPCRRETKILEDLDEKMGGSIKICKSNVDEDPEFAEMFSVETIPSLIFYKNGEKMGQFSGILDREGIRRMLEI